MALESSAFPKRTNNAQTKHKQCFSRPEFFKSVAISSHDMIGVHFVEYTWMLCLHSSCRQAIHIYAESVRFPVFSILTLPPPLPSHILNRIRMSRGGDC